MSERPRGRLPFALKPGEHLILKGGFGGIAGWMWVFPTLPGLLLMAWIAIQDVPAHLARADVGGACYRGVWFFGVLVIAFWPWLRSGRYWLTTRRLVWAPYLGNRRTLSTAEIAHATIRPTFFGVLTSSLAIRGDRRLSLCFIGGMERLWGALWIIAEFASLDLPAEFLELDEVACKTGLWRRGLSSTNGVIVFRPGYVAFLPTDSAYRLLNFAGDLAGSLLGVGVDRAQAKPPFDILVRLLCAYDAVGFDERIARIVERYGGLRWRAREIEVSHETDTLPLCSAILIVRNGKDVLRTSLRGPELAAIRHIVLDWTGGVVPPVSRPLLRMALTCGLATLPAIGFLIYTLVQWHKPVTDLGPVAAGKVMDRNAVPAGSYVTVSGQPDLSQTVGVCAQKCDGFLVRLREEPRLVLYCRSQEPLAGAIRDRKRAEEVDNPEAPIEGAIPPPAKTWQVSGRLCDSKDSEGHRDVPWDQVKAFAKAEDGDAGGKDVRVLVVGEGPLAFYQDEEVGVNILAAGFIGGFPAILWLLTLWRAVWPARMDWGR